MDNPPPFEKATANTGYASHGVVKINNIPFTVTAQEVAQFISRYTPITPMLKKNHQGCPIHIIMEKPTGKTMDCFVEFPSYEAARECVNQFNYTAQPGRGTKLGTRTVTLDVSSQAELMRAVFPRARLVMFDEATGQPHVLGQDDDPSWTAGFRGYFTLEEVYGLIRFAENPPRSPFVLKCLQRPFESTITTLYKFPWAAVQTYTVGARNILFETVYKQLGVLSKKVGVPVMPNCNIDVTGFSPSFQSNNQTHYQTDSAYGQSQFYNPLPQVEKEVGLSPKLLVDLLFAGLNVPTFSQIQKVCLRQQAGSYGRGVTLNRFAETWPFQTLNPPSDVTDYIVKFWLELFDTGHDLLVRYRQNTTYEKYIVFSRNRIGFPVAEWTPKGLELPLEDAMRVELAAMMVYVNAGRSAWATQKGLHLRQWKVQGLMDLLRIIANEKDGGRHFEPGEPSPYKHSDNDISPTTTEFDSYVLPAFVNGIPVAPYGPIRESHPARETQSTEHHFNAANVVDFVPASANQSRSSETAFVTTRDQRPTNIWALSPAEQVRTNRSSLPDIGTNFAPGVNVRRNYSQQATPGNSSIAPSFRNPFATSTKQDRGLSHDAGAGVYRNSSLASQTPIHPGPMGITAGSLKSISETNVIQRAATQNDARSFGAYSAARPQSSVQSSSTPSQNLDQTSVGAQMRNLSIESDRYDDHDSDDSSTPRVQAATPETALGSSDEAPCPVKQSGSPTPKAVQVYPNITLSTATQSPYQSFTPVQVKNTNQFSTVPTQATIPALPAWSYPAEKLRAQSIPVTAPSRGGMFNAKASNAATTSSTGFVSGEKRGSLPVTAEETANCVANAEHGEIVDQGPTQSDSGRGGRLSAGELWDQVGRY